MIREKSPQFQRKDNIIELPKPAPKVLALPKSLNQERRSMVPKLQLPQLILDVPADSAPRSKSVGARPSKPLPTLLVPTKSLPKVVIDENNNNGVVEVKQLTQVKDERINAANFVEIEIQYSFIKKVRLPRSFSMDQLQAAARQQAVPKDFDFRYGRFLSQASLHYHELHGFYSNHYYTNCSGIKRNVLSICK